MATTQNISLNEELLHAPGVLSRKQKAAELHRNFGLDVIRSIAVLTVVCLHMNFIIYTIHLTDTLLYYPDGVSIFFVLSGYLIGGILLKTIRENGSSRKELYKFWWMRWFRTLPNYFLFTIFVFVVFNHGHVKIANLFFLQNFYKTLNQVYVETWSLSVEEWFYLLFPALLFGLYAINKKLKQSVLVTILLFCVIGFCIKYYYIAYYLKISFYNMKLQDPKWFEIKTLVVNRMDCISIGVLGACLKKYYPVSWSAHKRLLFILGMTIVVAYTIIENRLFHNMPVTRNPFFWSSFYVIYSIGILLLFPAIEVFTLKNKFINRFFTHTSKISYSMYLLHLSLLKIVGILFSAAKVPTTPLWTFMILSFYMLLLYLLCHLIYTHFEKRFIDYRIAFINKFIK